MKVYIDNVYILFLTIILSASNFSFSQNKNVILNTDIHKDKATSARVIFQPSVDSSDYFRTKQSGYWHEPSTWMSSLDGITWTDAIMSPTYKSKGIILSNSDTVYVLHSIIIDQMVVDSDAVMIVSSLGSDTNVVVGIRNGVEEKDMIVYGTVIATGTPPSQSPYTINPVGKLSFEAGSVYDHNQNGGAIPLSTWEVGSTLKLTGTIDQRPANRTQNYSNIIVDLPQLTIHFNMNFWDNVITGNITVIHTAGESRWVLVGPQENEVRELTILGNFYQYGGNVNTHGSENPNSHAIIRVMGDVVVTGGNFSIARGSQGGTGTTTWYLNGDLSMSNCETLNDNPAGSKFVFVGENDHKLLLDNVRFLRGGLPIEVDNTTLDIGTSSLRGEGMFAIRPGSTLICANEGGLDSSLQNNGFTEFTTEADFVFNGTNPQVTGVKLPYAVKNLVINNQAGVYLSNDVTVNNSIELLAGNLLLNGKTVTLGKEAEILPEGGNVTGTSGKLTTTRVIKAPNQLDIGGMGIVLTSPANLDTTIIEVIHSSIKVLNGNSINRTYHLSPKLNSGLNAILKLSYIESELNTLMEDSLRLFYSDNGLEDNWLLALGLINTQENFIELTKVDRMSYWTLAYGNTAVSVDDDNNTIPEEFALYQNYPNPFNPTTVIKFDLPEDSYVDLSIYNIIGEKVLTLISEQIEKGRHSREVNAQSLPSGAYIYKLSAGDKVFTRKMVLLK